MKKLLFWIILLSTIWIFRDDLTEIDFKEHFLTVMQWTSDRIVNVLNHLNENLDEEVNDVEESTYRTINLIELNNEFTANTRLFFYEQLNESEKIVYQLILNGLVAFEQEILIENSDTDQIHDIFRRVLYDNPQLFWVSGAATTTIRTPIVGTAYAIFKPTYSHSTETILQMQQQIEYVVEEFLSQVPSDLSEVELVRHVYEFIIRSTEYDLESKENQNIYSVFVNQSSVCAGISRAAQLLLNRLGIFATYITGVAYVPGQSSEPINHAWNLVKIGGEYYYLDVTWGMPTFSEEPNIVIDVIYDYLLVSGDFLYNTHTVSEHITVPTVNSLTHTFFYLNNMFWNSIDEEGVLQVMTIDIKNSEPFTALQFASSELFRSMSITILSELAPEAARILMQYHGLQSTTYFIREKPNLNKISIYWIYE